MLLIRKLLEGYCCRVESSWSFGISRMVGLMLSLRDAETLSDLRVPLGTRTLGEELN